MAQVRVKMLSAGAVALMNSAEMQDILLGLAEPIADRAGPGFVADVQPGSGRAHAMVKSTDYRSMRAQAENNALLKAIGGGS